jgi:predicted enzyme related to lactoylglutathione lyase
MDRAIAFYRDVLGLSPSYESPYWTSIPIGDCRIGLHPPFSESAPKGQGGWVIGVETQDIVALRATLVEAGAWVMEGYHQTPGGAVMDFRDPDGNQLQAIQVGSEVEELG